MGVADTSGMNDWVGMLLLGLLVGALASALIMTWI